MRGSTGGSAMTDLSRRLVHSPQGALGLVLLIVLVVACVGGPWIAPYHPEAIDFLGRFRPPGSHNWLGTDQFGRDVLSRLLVGARDTLPLALAATLAGSLAGA